MDVGCVRESLRADSQSAVEVLGAAAAEGVWIGANMLHASREANGLTSPPPCSSRSRCESLLKRGGGPVWGLLRVLVKGPVWGLVWGLVGGLVWGLVGGPGLGPGWGLGGLQRGAFTSLSEPHSCFSSSNNNFLASPPSLLRQGYK